MSAPVKQSPAEPALTEPERHGTTLPSFLDDLYSRYNHPSWIYPDPLTIVLEYPEPADMETAGIICSALALGTVKAIMSACHTVLGELGPHPATGLASLSDSDLVELLAGFRYRFFGPSDLAFFLGGIRRVRESYGSLEGAFLSVMDPGEPDYAGAASRFVRLLATASPGAWRSNLFPDPECGSAAKRVFLYLRWMVRRDAVDPGPWTRVPPAGLVIPLDTHMAAACRCLGLLGRTQTDLRAAREATAAFRAILPEDPVRYDFCMTRPGIHPDLDPAACFDLNP
ncbi:MAG: TIGR02757 family protein [Spirochaetia bacterium]|nr:TIGR02757 family protein [Spirochaetia bacterium]